MNDIVLDRDDHAWLEGKARINLQLNEERLLKLKALAVRLGLDGSDARTSKVVWSLVDKSDAILQERDKIKEDIRKRMESAGIPKYEL